MDAAGIAIYNISVKDSGGSTSGGIDTSPEQSVRFVTIGGVLKAQFTLNISVASLTPGDRDVLRRQIAKRLELPPELVVLSLSEVSGSGRRLLDASHSCPVTFRLFQKW
jgi:hypothetical protein